MRILVMGAKNNTNVTLDVDLFPQREEIIVEKENIGSLLMDHPFDPKLIDISTQSPTISLIIERIKEDEIDLFTGFQRNSDLWDTGKQSRLIESILIRLPLPAFYFDGTDDDKWLIVDGLQRLSALKNFIVDDTLVLQDLEFLHEELEGKKYSELSRHLQREINETQLTSYVIKPGTPANVKYNIFKRINTGGLVLEGQEIRHALNQGIPAEFITELADTDAFRAATEYKIKTTRMLDREFVNRFISFYLNNPEDYTPDMDSFLNFSMEKIAKLTENERKKIKHDFIRAMELAKDIFSNWAFRKADLYPDRRKPINKALFEVWSVCLAKLSESEKEIIYQNKKRVFQGFIDILTEYGYFWNCISHATGEKNRIIYRFKVINDLLRGNLNAE